VIVVDNGSTDGSAHLVRTWWPDIRLIANEQNLGYQRARNQGIGVATGEHRLLINADARPEAGCLSSLL
jgi:GT2 family glycosyltransferase